MEQAAPAASVADLSDSQFASLVVNVRDAANVYAAVSHVQWGLWGLIQAKVSDIDFDFLSYAAQRLDMYHKEKLAILDS